MKKINYIALASVAVAITFVSCSKGEMQTSPVSRVTVLTANIDQTSDTKTNMYEATEGSTNVSIVWTAGDKLSVLSGASFATNNEFALKLGDEGKTSGSFTGASIAGDIIAVYPYSSDVEYASDIVKLNIPKTQAYTSASFAQNSVPMVAKGTVGTPLDFKYLFSAIAFKVNGNGKNVTKVTVAATIPLWGPAEITTLDAIPVIMMTGTDSKYYTVELTCDTAEDISSDKVFFVAVPAGTYTFAVNVYCGTEVYHQSYTTAKTFTAGKIKYNSTAKSFTNNGPAYVDGSYIGAGIMAGSNWWAPVNCGYDAADYKYGKLYQWGRKYGQGYYEGSNIDADYPGKEGGKQNLVELSTPLSYHPDYEQYNGSFYWKQSNWYGGYSIANNRLWNSCEGTSDPVSKSSFDPCPTGWRVPTRTELSALYSGSWVAGVDISGKNSGDYNGRIFGSTPNQLFLPASGCRGYNNGSSSGRGWEGDYWSSSVNGTNSWYLMFGNGGTMMTSYSRSFGYSVRCINE